MRVELRYFKGCPNWRTADRRLRSLAQEQGFEVHHRLVSTPEEAEVEGFRGSPTIVVDGRDPFARGRRAVRHVMPALSNTGRTRGGTDD